MKRCLFCIGVFVPFLCMTFLGCDLVGQLAPLPAFTQAVAHIEPLGDNELTGIAVFTDLDDTISLLIEVEGLAASLYAVHIHEAGDCSVTDGSSAGGHWNPTDVAHGRWGENEFHLGDLGNIEVEADGIGFFELETDLWEIGTGSDIDIVGKSIIVHAGADDFTSQPSGNAGARIGCGVIEMAE